ncbi:acetate--CoA ligase family protein [Desulfoluna spongiiphila]|uniref:acetate--CoA ligase family protein n=1 Tax=Desulfoluna spongiiphila TaxID=419481 RepID=UPI0012559C38|nr:acetate--CoA ligase family protein [Desulfoluna spongiiphila]VVS95256.1 atp-grasp fold [Desulfoluna spongiiphila]
MEKIFYPESIAIWGLSNRENNIPRLMLENLIRWGYEGRLFGIHPKGNEKHVDGVKMYKSIKDLPQQPDLAVFLLPARLIPGALREAGEFGVRRAAILSGGFNESGAEGEKLAEELMAVADDFGIRFIGPNGLTVANTANGLCLPFTPTFKTPRGGMSLITQSGGMGLFLWHLMADENIGLAKFASIGNKLNVSEVDCIRYFGEDPETKVICLYLESITDGRQLMEAASEAGKPVIIYKANTTQAGSKAAMSHTAAISNNEEIIDAAFERAGILRIEEFDDFIGAAKIFELPPMRGNRIMVMSPAGGFTVLMADLCEKAGFEFADPGEAFYKEIAEFTNAGVITLSNPLDLGDIYDPSSTASVINLVLHNDKVDGAVYLTQNPQMPKNDDVFNKMFKTDISKEVTGAIRSSGKPMASCLYGPSKTINRVKQNVNVPIFNTPESMIRIMKLQQRYHAKQAEPAFTTALPHGIDMDAAASWVRSHTGTHGEEALELLTAFGIPVAKNQTATTPDEAVAAAEAIGYPVVMKVISPDAVHKSEAGGVLMGLNDASDVRNGFDTIRANLEAYKKDARFDGVRLMAMAGSGHDMFVGGSVDDSFGPVALFGYGGIYIEVFQDAQTVLCPSSPDEIETKITRLKSAKILAGTRGKAGGDISGYIDLIHRVTHLMAQFPQIQELDLNPVRVLEDGSGVLALDARCRIEKRS